MKLTKIIDELIDKTHVSGVVRTADLINLLASARRKAEDYERYEAGEVAFKGLTLGELIDKLKVCPPNGYLRYDWPGAPVVSGLGSYRGYYEDLALGYADEDDPSLLAEHVTVGHTLAMLERAVGSTFPGYKGGEFAMDRDSRVWVSNYGDCYSVAVVDVGTVCGGSVMLRTWRTE